MYFFTTLEQIQVKDKSKKNGLEVHSNDRT